MSRAHGKMARPNDFKKAISQLMTYLKAYRKTMVIAFTLAMLGAIFSLIGPQKLSDMTDLISKGLATTIDVKAISKIGLFLVVLFLLSSLFTYIQGRMMAIMTQKVTYTLRQDIDQKMARLPLRYFDSTRFGDVLSRMTNDVDIVGQTLNQSLGTFITAISLFIGSLVMMFYTNAIMAISGILATLIGFLLMGSIMKISQKYFVAQQQNLGRLNAHVEEVYTGHQVMKAFNGEAQSQQQFAKLNEDLYQSARRSTFLSGLMMPLMRFIGNFGYVVVCVVGAYLCFNDKIEFGVIVAFMMYIRMFTQPLSQLAQVFNSLQQTAAASERIFEFLDEEEMASEEGYLSQLDKPLQGQVDFEHVSFQYTPEKEIIKDFSLHVNPGETVAIVGPTGAGKTTIVNLLMKFYDLHHGDILLDGHSTKTMTRQLVHDQFCMVLQDTWLFEGTVKENIVYNQTDILDEDVVAAAKAVGIDHFIQTLPQGYDTVLDDDSALSQGQRQLITIARALVSKAPLLILDEATSSVDTRTELLVQQAMDHLMKGRTSFIIAHRLSTIKNADNIIVMRDGHIVEQGNHDALLAQNGFYAELYNSQFAEADA